MGPSSARKCGAATACCTSSSQSTTPTMLCATKPMMRVPPGEPTSRRSRPALVEQHRRRHARQRPLAAFDAIRDGLAADGRHVVEVRELVVQDEPADHELAAERALHARRHRDRVAESVDDREVARRRPLRSVARREVPSRRRQRLARPRSLAIALIGSISAARVAQIARVEQRGDGRRDELRVAEIEIAVGEREPIRLGERGESPARARRECPAARTCAACRAPAASSRRPRTAAAGRRPATRDTACTAARDTCASYDARSCGVIRPGRTLLSRTSAAIAARELARVHRLGAARPRASRSAAAYSGIARADDRPGAARRSRRRSSGGNPRRARTA